MPQCSSLSAEIDASEVCRAAPDFVTIVDCWTGRSTIDMKTSQMLQAVLV